MKKFFYILLTAILLLSNCIATFFITEKQALTFPYYGNSVTFEFTKLSDFNDFLDDMVSFSQKNNVNISQINEFSNKDIYVYSTNPQVDSRIHLLSGHYPQNTEYLSTDARESDSRCVGVIAYPRKQHTLKIYNFHQVKNHGLDTDFYFNTTDKSLFQNFKNEFSKYGDIKINTNHNLTLKVLYTTIINYKSVLFIIAFAYISFLIASFLLTLQHKNKVIVAELWGYNRHKTITPNSKEFYLCFLLFFLVYSVGITIVGWPSNSISNLLEQWGVVAFVCLVDFLVLFISMYLMNLLALKTLFSTFQIKGRVPLKQLKRLTVLLKVILYFIVISIALNALNLSTYYNSGLSALIHWENSKDIYRISVNPPLSKINDFQYESNLHSRFLNFYLAEKSKYNIFMIVSTNFYPISSINGTPVYFYTENVSEEQSYYDPYGRSIRIDMNYLNHNPIALSDGYDYEKDFINNPNTLNLLVPESLKSNEKIIMDNYLDYFYFSKVTVSNIYNEALNQPVNNQSKSDLSINIIYTKNNQKYFTYNKDTGDAKNQITDPIAIIYNNDMHVSFLGAAMTTSVYFEDTSHDQAYLQLSKALKKHNITEIKQVHSVYGEITNTVNQLRKLYRNELIGLLITCIFAVITLRFMIVSHYNLNKQRIMIQHLNGYSNMKKNKTLIEIALITNVIVGALIAYSNDIYTAIIITAIFSIFDIAIISFIHYQLCHQQINDIIKGDLV